MFIETKSRRFDTLPDKRRYYFILGDKERNLSTDELITMGILRQGIGLRRGYPARDAGLTSLRCNSSRGEEPGARGEHFVSGTPKHIEGLTNLLKQEGFQPNT